MALQNSQGNYLRIDRVDLNTRIAFCSKWKDVGVRQSPTDFDKPVQESHYVNTFDSEATGFTSTGNLLDDITSVAYLALKNEPPFNGASGETWTDC